MSDSIMHPPSKMRICPKCETLNDESRLPQTGYRCSECGFEMAYTDQNPNGTVRGIFGYLRPAGEVINNRYRIRQLLGKGGFGSTYLVQDLRVQGKRRALKEIPQVLFDEQEVKLLSQLNHPSIPDITDRFTANELIYLVLEFGGTRTLASECQSLGERIPLSILLPWMRQLCDALIYLHSQNPPVIHRDLKPENVLLDDNDRIMLVDFGIAKVRTEIGGTRMLARAGSQGFSPPEQILGTGTDERSDIYSLGATFYRLLTGQAPPPAHERVAGKEFTSPGTLVPGLPTAIDELIVSMMNLNLNQRPASVERISVALADIEGAPAGMVPDFFKTTKFTPNDSTGISRWPVTPVQGARIIADDSQSALSSEFLPKQKRHARMLPATMALVLAITVGICLFTWKTHQSTKDSVQTAVQTPPDPGEAVRPSSARSSTGQPISVPPPAQAERLHRLVSPLEGRQTKVPAPISLPTLGPQLPASAGNPSAANSISIAVPQSTPDTQLSTPLQQSTRTSQTAAVGSELENTAPSNPLSTSAPMVPPTAPALSAPPANSLREQAQRPAPPNTVSGSSALETFEKTREKQTQTDQTKQSQDEPLMRKQRSTHRSNAPANSNGSGWTIRYIQ
jgi:eukaryotic-like serine/threonine-protein kinase